MRNQELRTKPWRLIKSEKGADLPLFDVEIRTMENPRNQMQMDALVLNARDTINVIAINDRGEWILVEQFRFGLNRPLVELPAGIIDPGESELEAAQRELREETGYESDNWYNLGSSWINPAYLTNRCTHFLARNAHKVADVSPDETEDLQVHAIPVHGLWELFSLSPLRDAVGNAALSYLKSFIEEQT